MTISIWRYSHLALAVSCFIFLSIASVTGIILSVDAAQHNQNATADRLKNITVAQTVTLLQDEYLEITELSVKHQNVTLKAIDNDGNEVNTMIDPTNGAKIKTPNAKSPFITSVTSLHRSLFLHETGRIIMLVNAIILAFIAISGIALVIQRQQGVWRFFSKIGKSYFSQYYHVLLGRIMLIPILILAITGTFMCLHRFNVFKDKNQLIQLAKSVSSKETLAPSDFKIFKEIKLSDVKKIAFPFSDEPEEHYTLTLNDREITVDQFNGKILTEATYPATEKWQQLSVMLHTGRANPIWAIILGIAAINILFFIYSGFVITFKRTAHKIKNKYKPTDADYIILVGSENGSTLGFANGLYKQLIALGKKPFLAVLNNYQVYPNASEMIILTATYGLGNAPSNAQKFESLIQKLPQKQQINVSVVGFGSKSYPDFCGYAQHIHQLLSSQSWINLNAPVFTIEDKSLNQFCEWIKEYGISKNIALVPAPSLYSQKPKILKPFVVTERKTTQDKDLFIIKIKPLSNIKFTSGDLLTIYPANDHRERLYSIAQIGNQIELVVRAYPNGLGSKYLQSIEEGTVIKARVVENPNFHFTPKINNTIFIANGTGIAPFRGMIAQNKKKIKIDLFYGMRAELVYQDFFKGELENHLSKGYLHSKYIAFSRASTTEKLYVTHLLESQKDLIINTLSNSGCLFICGSLNMQQDVLQCVDNFTMEDLQLPVTHFIENGQIKSDCY